MAVEEMPFMSLFLYAYADSAFGYFVVVFFLYSLMEEEFSVRRMARALPLWAVACPAAALTMSVLRILLNEMLPELLLLSTQNMLVLSLWGRCMWRLSVLRSLSAVGVAGLLQMSASLLCNWTVSVGKELIGFSMAYDKGIFLLMLPIMLGIALLLRKSGFGRKFRSLLESGADLRRVTAVIVFLEIAFIVQSNQQVKISSEYLTASIFPILALSILALALIFYLAQRDMDRRRLQMQEDIIAQQRLYEQSLEELRQEMRTFRHDYKNLLIAYAGNPDGGLHGSLRELEEGFDRRLGEKIRFSVQVGNLCIPQVRSLLLSKLTAMAKQEIVCRLEVLYRVTTVGMDVWDFVRCLGILTDNAMEAAAETEEPWVEIVLLQQENSLFLRVANPRRGALDPVKMWEEGQSSKGAGRGMGLPGYRRILRRYVNASPVTEWEEGLFVQELTIGPRTGTGGRNRKRRF